MAYFGKKFKKVKEISVMELLERTGYLNEMTRIVNRASDVFMLDKLGDDSYRLTALDHGEVVLDKVVVTNQETIIPTPSGLQIKAITVFEGDVMKTIFTLPDGRVIGGDRYFTRDTMKLEIYIPGVDIIGVVDYKAID